MYGEHRDIFAISRNNYHHVNDYGMEADEIMRDATVGSSSTNDATISCPQPLSTSENKQNANHWRYMQKMQNI